MGRHNVTGLVAHKRQDHPRKQKLGELDRGDLSGACTNPPVIFPVNLLVFVFTSEFTSQVLHIRKQPKDTGLSRVVEFV